MVNLVGQKAPEFKLDAVVNGEFRTVSLADYRGKWVVLFFYPLDFTFVCPTEIVAFSDRVEEFRKLGAEVLAASVDSKYTHLAWINTPREKGGLGPMKIALLADLNKETARAYNVLMEPPGVALRGLFIIDAEGVVQHQTVNNLGVGRNVDEVLRLVQAFQFVQKSGEVCPINWTPGKATMKPDPKGSQEYFKKQ
jgi:peroxiredoxin (alkyl hydroperoxide reductase subunit C)